MILDLLFFWQRSLGAGETSSFLHSTLTPSLLLHFSIFIGGNFTQRALEARTFKSDLLVDVFFLPFFRIPDTDQVKANLF